jgi:hypothetical protein
VSSFKFGSLKEIRLKPGVLGQELDLLKPRHQEILNPICIGVPHWCIDGDRVPFSLNVTGMKQDESQSSKDKTTPFSLKTTSFSVLKDYFQT